MSDDDIMRLTQRCRIELNTLDFYEGDLRRDQIIARFIREAVEEAIRLERENWNRLAEERDRMMAVMRQEVEKFHKIVRGG